jgi:hypothetical protein
MRVLRCDAAWAWPRPGRRGMYVMEWTSSLTVKELFEDRSLFDASLEHFLGCYSRGVWCQGGEM